MSLFDARSISLLSVVVFFFAAIVANGISSTPL
jgi:hypothetical protein